MDEELSEDRRRRDPLAPVQAVESALLKKRHKRTRVLPELHRDLSYPKMGKKAGAAGADRREALGRGCGIWALLHPGKREACGDGRRAPDAAVGAIPGLQARGQRSGNGSPTVAAGGVIRPLRSTVSRSRGSPVLNGRQVQIRFRFFEIRQRPLSESGYSQWPRPEPPRCGS